MHSKNRQLITVLTSETQKDKLQWKDGTNQDQYTLQSKSNKIIVGSEYVSVLGELEPCEHVFMTITDLIGNEIDQVGALKVKHQSLEILEDYQLLKDLYESARRSAKGIDKVIDNLLNEFDAAPF